MFGFVHISKNYSTKAEQHLLERIVLLLKALSEHEYSFKYGPMYLAYMPDNIYIYC